jgi:hypothetical protein
MSYDLLAEKLAKLPAWARDYIRQLQEGLANAQPIRSQLFQKITALELANRKLRDRLAAVEELMQCAARGGHETARVYVDRIIEDHKSTGDD